MLRLIRKISTYNRIWDINGDIPIEQSHISMLKRIDFALGEYAYQAVNLSELVTKQRGREFPPVLSTRGCHEEAYCIMANFNRELNKIVTHCNLSKKLKTLNITEYDFVVSFQSIRAL